MSKLINCKDCGKEISKNAKTCPNCGAKIKKANIILRIFLAIAVFIILSAIIANLEDGSTTASTNSSTEVSSSKKSLDKVESEKKPDLELLEWKVSRGEYDNTIIIGKVKNNKNKELSYAQIQFNLYDSSEAQIGSALANINNLEAGGIWRFEAICIEEDFKTAKFKELTGF